MLSALETLAKDLPVALRDLQVGRTQGQRVHGYVDAGAGLTQLTSANDAIIATCRKNA